MRRSRCSVEGCGLTAHARGWCSKHYNRWRKHGDALWTPPTDAERFFAKFEMGEAWQCWTWVAGLDEHGYGRFYWDGAGGLAHRFAYEYAYGSIDPDLDVDHTCRNRACVNFHHLEEVTHAENMRRMSAAITECKWGHAYDEANTGYTPGDGWRYCRTCLREKMRRRKARERAMA